MATKTKRKIDAPTDEAALAAWEEGVCLKVTIGTFSVVRPTTVDQDTVSTKADPEMVKARKKIFESEAFSAAMAHERKLRDFLETKSLQTDILARGMYFVPMINFKEVMAGIREADELRKTKLAPAILAGWGETKKACEKRLGPLWDEDQFPTKEEIRDAFYITVRPFQFTAPARVKEHDLGLYEESRRMLQQGIVDAVAGFRRLLRSQLLEVTEKLAEALTGKTESGGKKALRQATIDNVTEWLDNFAPKDVSKDADLGAQVEKMRRLLSGIDPDEVKGDDELRGKLGAQVMEIKQSIGKLVVEAPGRAIRLKKKEAAA